jgi:hypothetical protein
VSEEGFRQHVWNRQPFLLDPPTVLCVPAAATRGCCGQAVVPSAELFTKREKGKRQSNDYFGSQLIS